MEYGQANENTGSLDLIVHIGTGKTGSTSIQKTLGQHKEILGRHDVVYLGLNFEGSPVQKYGWQRNTGWHDLIRTGKQKSVEQLQEVLDGTIAALKKDGTRTAIWSNESLFENGQWIIPVLARVQQAGINVKVVIYIRRHDAWARSAYLQWGIKHKTYSGPIKSFMEWYKSRDLRLYPGVNNWFEAGWSDMSVRNFDACGDVVEDFLTYCGIKDEGISVCHENETPHATALALWAMYNAQSEVPVFPDDIGMLMGQAGLLEKPVHECSLADLLPTREEVEQVQNDLEEDRNLLNELFRICSQPEMEQSELEFTKISYTQSQIDAALLLMLKKQHDKIEILRKAIENLSNS